VPGCPGITTCSFPNNFFFTSFLVADVTLVPCMRGRGLRSFILKTCAFFKESQVETANVQRQLLRHTLATMSYRSAKSVRDAPESFGSFSSGDKGRTPAQILAHMGDLMDWGLSIAKGAQAWHDSTPLPWSQEVERYFAAVKAFDDYLAGDGPLAAPPEKLFQGPIADALNHTGQINMLRRMAGCSVRAENYYRADITDGRVGAEQAKPGREF
jgi:hypothetical protein